MSLALKISIVEKNEQKTMRFAPTMSVSEACRQIAEKIGITGEDHGLFLAASNPKEKAQWLRMEVTLGYYELENGVVLEYRKKHRLLKVRLLDNTQKKILIDDSLDVRGIVNVLGEKLGLENIEEFSLQTEGDTSGKWLNAQLTLHEQGLGLDDGVVLKKKYFVSDANVDTNNPAQVHFVYIQSRNAIVEGSHPCTKMEAVQFAALECQVNYGNNNPNIHNPLFFKNMLASILPPSWAKEKLVERDIIQQWKKVMGMSDLNAKFRYIQLCRSLKTYGITCFNVSDIVDDHGKKKLVPILLGVTRDSVLKMDVVTKEVYETYPLKTVRRWAAAASTFTIDFGDHQDNYLSVATKESEAIAGLLAGYVDIILKKRKDTGRIVVTDDASIAREDTIALPRGRAHASSASSSTWGSSVNNYGGGNLHGVGYAGGAAPMNAEPLSRLQAIKSGMSGKQNINDLRSARGAIDDLLTELNTGTSMLKQDPFSVINMLQGDGLVPDQIAHRLSICSAVAAASAVKLQGLTAENLNDCIGDLDANASRLAQELAGMLESTLMLAAASPTADDDKILQTAKAFVEGAKSALMQLQKLRDFPSDPTPRDALGADVAAMKLADAYLRGTGEGMLIDGASLSLLEETAAALNTLTNDINTAVNSPEIEKLIDAQELRDGLKNCAKASVAASGKTLQNIQLYAPTMLMESAHKDAIGAALDELEKAKEDMMENLLECSGTDAADLLMNQYEALSAGVEQLQVALKCVTRTGGGASELAAAAKSVSMATAKLLSATTMASDEVLFDNAKNGVRDSVDGLVTVAKAAAGKANDKNTRSKLLSGAEALNEALKQLLDSASIALNHPNDPLKHERVMVASQKMAMALHNLMGDADRQGAVSDLLSAVKDTAANTSSLIGLARAAALHTQRVDPKNKTVHDIFSACKLTAENMAILMNALKTSSSDNIEDMPATISELVAATQGLAAPASNLVAVLKVENAKIGPNPKARYDILTQAERVAEAIRKLLGASQQVIEASGIAEIEEAVKQLSGVDSVISAAILAAANGTLVPTVGQVEENAIELLSLATNALASPTMQLVDACRDPSTKQIGPSSKACVNGMTQVVNAAKTLASTLPKNLQHPLLQCSKDLALKMSQLFAAVRTVSSNPSDPAMNDILMSASRQVSEARANIMRTAKGAHDPISNECDAAAELIRKEAARLTPHLFNSGNFSTFVDQLTSYAKATQAAALQLIESSRENGDALTASCHSAASLVTNLVDSANSTAATAPKEDDKNEIVKAAGITAEVVAAMIGAAKVAFLNKDEVSNELLIDQNQKVEKALQHLVNVANSARPGQLECEQALEMIAKFTALLDPSAPYPHDVDDDAKNPEKVRDSISNSAKDLAMSSASILSSSRSNPEKAGQAALESAKAIAAVLTAIKLSTPKVQGLDEFSGPAKQIEDLLNSVSLNVSKPKIVVRETKALAPLLADVVTTSKKVAALLTDGAAQQKLVKAAQALHTARTAFVNHAKAAAVKAPGSEEDLLAASADLLKATNKLVVVSAKVLPQEAVAPELKAQNDLLLSSSKALAVATSKLILASKVASSKKDSNLHSQLSTCVKDVSDAIQALLNATKGLAPDQVKCDEALEAISEGLESLDGMALTAAVGGVIDTTVAEKSHDVNRDTLAQTALELSQAVTIMVTSALKKDPSTLAKSADVTAKKIKEMVTSTSAVASTAPERTTQKQVIALSKAVAENVHKLVSQCKVSNTQAPEVNQQKMAEVSKDTSEAIKGLVSTLKLGVAGSKDCDEAAVSISTALKQLDEPVPASKKSFKQSKEEMGIVAKALAPAIQKLMNAAKNQEDAAELGPSARALADTMPMLVGAVKSAVGATTADQAKQDIIESGKAVANAAKVLVQNAKFVASDRTNQASLKKLAAAQLTLNEALAHLGSSLATGEMDCEQSVNEIRNLLASLDAASLFAAAGQFEYADSNEGIEEAQSKLAKASADFKTTINDVPEAAKTSMEKLGAKSKDVTTSLTMLIAAGKTSAALMGEIPLQQGLLTATRAVAVSSRDLLLASKNFCATPDSEYYKDLMAQTTEEVQRNINQLLTEAQNASAEAIKGDKKMNATKAEILRLIDRFHEADNVGNQQANGGDVIESAKGVATATARMIASVNSSQEELLNNAKDAVKANTQLLANAKGVIRLTKDKDHQKNILDAAKLVASATTKLMDALKAGNKNTNSGQKRLNDSSEEVANAISDVINAAGVFPGAEKAKGAKDIEDVAEEELLNAAKAIEEAAATLKSSMSAKKEVSENGADVEWTPEEIMVGDAILESTRNITDATVALVKTAVTLQKEIQQQQPKTKQGPEAKLRFYRKDSIFTEGLISAAKAVAATTQQLVHSANNVTQGMVGEEALIASAKGVAASTAQLVASSRVKVGTDNPQQKKLQEAAKNVIGATTNLVETAKGVTTAREEKVEVEEKAKEAANYSMSIVAEMEQQMKILKLEKELEKAREALLGARKKNYQT